jgi:choline dehydrogenase-like flavoprotein
MSAEHYDVIIIGTGAGGGTLAHRLAPSGKKILLLERGPFLPREKQNWDVRSVFVENRYVSKDTWHELNGKDAPKPFQPGSHYFVGGATKMYGAALFRFRERDFGRLRHHDGISPEWPITYADLEPYYTQAETLYHVHGKRGADPTEPPASGPYPHPPLTHEPRIQELYHGLQKAGYHPFPAPTGILVNERAMHLSPCIRCDTCDGFPCLLHAKADADVVCVRPALKHSNVTLLPNSQVKRLETSPTGREVNRVVVERDGHEEIFSANIVVVSCGAANSARLLLMSANDKHSRGLANGSDQVGRNYMFHNSEAVVAISKRENPTLFQKTLSLNDFYFGSDDFDFPLGNIQMIGKSQGPMFREDAPRLAPGFTLEIMAKHAVDFWLTTEDLPDPNNRITLNDRGEIQLSYKFNNQESARRLKGKLKYMLEYMDCHHHLLPNNLYFGKHIPIAGVGHQAGTCRFGTDSTTSVLDVNCKAHELDNLYVVDASFFVSIAAVNPSLTIIANALRVGDHLLERLK